MSLISMDRCDAHFKEAGRPVCTMKEGARYCGHALLVTVLVTNQTLGIADRNVFYGRGVYLKRF